MDKPRFSQADRAQRRREMAAAVKSGTAISEVATSFGVSQRLVYFACLECGVSPSNKFSPEPPAMADKEKHERIVHQIAQRIEDAGKQDGYSAMNELARFRYGIADVVARLLGDELAPEQP